MQSFVRVTQVRKKKFIFILQYKGTQKTINIFMCINHLFLNIEKYVKIKRYHSCKLSNAMSYVVFKELHLHQIELQDIYFVAVDSCHT